MLKTSKSDDVSVLVIEHDPQELRALVAGLRGEGFSAVGAPSSAAALDMLSAGRFDAAIVDLMIPETNGLQLCRMIRSAFPDVATVLMSAYHLSAAQLVRANSGAVGFVPKPYRIDDLARFVRKKLERREASSSSPGIIAASDSAEDGRKVPFELPKTA